MITNDRLIELPVLWGVGVVKGRSQNGDGAAARHSHRSKMGFSVDPFGQSTHDDHAATREMTGDFPGDSGGRGGGLARPHDRNARSVNENSSIAGHPQAAWCVLALHVVQRTEELVRRQLDHFHRVVPPLRRSYLEAFPGRWEGPLRAAQSEDSEVPARSIGFEHRCRWTPPARCHELSVCSHLTYTWGAT